MAGFQLIVRCPACGAKNRVRLVSGQRVRVRCGSCGDVIPLDKRLVLLKLAGGALARFFAAILPDFLLKVVDLAGRLLRIVFSPLNQLWRLLSLRARRRAAWAVIAVLLAVYLFAEGTVKFSSLALLAALLLSASLAVLVAARGTWALRELVSRARQKLFRTCPSCGHRHFGWLKSCPQCGEK